MEGVRDAVRQERLHPAVGREHLGPAHAPRRRVALGGRGEVLAQLARDLGECAEPEHQGAKNGVLT